MKRILRKLRIWLGLEELNWWDRTDAGDEPLHIIRGIALGEALQRQKVGQGL